MKGASKVIMGTTLAMAIALAIILSLVLILLADLYCSLLLKRHRKSRTTTTVTATYAATDTTATLPAPGVLLHPPRDFLFPTLVKNIETNTNNILDLETPNPIESLKEHLVYICNPIYDNEAMGPDGAHTPYETPESSPSHLGYSDEDEFVNVCIYSPELVPMKKLQTEACSVSLRDASSLATSPSVSDTSSNNGVSLTASGSPRTSPSW